MVIRDETIFDSYWHTIYDRQLDFWSVCTMAGQVQYQVAAALEKEVADHIALTHNNWWDAIVWESYYDNIMEGIAIDVANYYGGEQAPLPDGVKLLTEDDWFDYDDEHETTREADPPRS